VLWVKVVYKPVDIAVIQDLDQPVLTVSQIAAMAQIHPQTVRQYDRLGLIHGTRTKGKSRRFSLGDVDRLRAIQLLSQEEGINLAGIRRIFTLSEENRILKRQLLALQHDAFFHVDTTGQTTVKRKLFRTKKIKGLLTSHPHRSTD
jgi:MerR family transcriptional regulator/heat shock protein HspR